MRARAHQLLTLAEQDGLLHFRFAPDRLAPTIDYVLATIRSDYPRLAIPFHSRWRHFSVGDRDRWALLLDKQAHVSARERTRIAFDLAVTSVLLDAGAGPAWRYCEEGGGEYSRSEGLAVASFHLFRNGVFSSDAGQPLRADAEGLASLSETDLAAGMQVRSDNPLVGLSGRANLLRRLGAAIARDPVLFGTPARIGHLADHLASLAHDGRLSATTIFAAAMRGFGDIWPGRHRLAGRNLGDTWRHSAARADDASDGLVPFHKLTQWLTYSLIEPLEALGLKIDDVDALTGLPEYRNGGLLIDMGVLGPRDSQLLASPLFVDAEPVVEWRALTVALLDRIAEGLRLRLGLDRARLPLARVLQGGTWSAGRRIARERRPDGGSPLTIDSDGTVF